MKKRTRAEVIKDLNQAKKRKQDMVEKGDKACSKYDLMFGYNADFYLNKCPILDGHIKWYEKELAYLTKSGIQQNLF